MLECAIVEEPGLPEQRDWAAGYSSDKDTIKTQNEAKLVNTERKEQWSTANGLQNIPFSGA